MYRLMYTQLKKYIVVYKDCCIEDQQLISVLLHGKSAINFNILYFKENNVVLGRPWTSYVDFKPKFNACISAVLCTLPTAGQDFTCSSVVGSLSF
jgi:hypothetical protein